MQLLPMQVSWSPPQGLATEGSSRLSVWVPPQGPGGGGQQHRRGRGGVTWWVAADCGVRSMVAGKHLEHQQHIAAPLQVPVGLVPCKLEWCLGKAAGWGV
jgi:hypothetical protein